MPDLPLYLQNLRRTKDLSKYKVTAMLHEEYPGIPIDTIRYYVRAFERGIGNSLWRAIAGQERELGFFISYVRILRPDLDQMFDIVRMLWRHSAYQSLEGLI